MCFNFFMISYLVTSLYHTHGHVIHSVETVKGSRHFTLSGLFDLVSV